MFDRYITVDWSASNRPKIGKDSIWICTLGPDGPPLTLNPPTRRAAESRVREMLVRAVTCHERVLVGFDFPYAYPRGFAAALGLEGPPWRAVWTYVARQMEDSASNQSNRFAVASMMNGRLLDHAFWGRPSTLPLDNLSTRRDCVRYSIQAETGGLGEWREVESRLRLRGGHRHSTWKLLGAGSVGSQTLTGIPTLLRLRDDPDLAAVSKVWPFELRVPGLKEAHPAIIHAEIWPSVVDFPARAGQVKDESQVTSLAEAFRTRDGEQTLRALFEAPPLDAAEEGWILGVA